MSWPSPNDMNQVDRETLGDLSPEEVLYEFEGPCIFTARTPADALVLAYLVEELEEDNLLRYLVSTTSDGTITALKEGMVSVREALLRGSMWIADLDYKHHPQRVFAVKPRDLPEDAMPTDETMLWAHLEPALRLRLEGEDILEGRTPALVLGQAGNTVAMALKSVFEWSARSLLPEGGGRPPDWLRSLYNLPAQRLAYGSLEVSFRAPEIPPDAQTAFAFKDATPDFEAMVTEGWTLLQKGLAWATCEVSDEDVEATDNEERLAILEAMRWIAPASTGSVSQVSVSGAKVGGINKVHRLDRKASAKVRKKLMALKKQREVQLRVFVGRVRDLDLDKLTFILRDVPGETTDFNFIMEDEQHLETAREAHYQELEVTVAGRSTNSKTWTVVQLEFKKEESQANISA